MENFVRQNPLYDVEQDLRKLLRQQAENIRQSTQTNDAAGGLLAAFGRYHWSCTERHLRREEGIPPG